MKQTPSIHDLQKRIKELEEEIKQLKSEAIEGSVSTPYLDTEQNTQELETLFSKSSSLLEEAQVKLDESLERFKGILDLLPQTVFEINSDGFFTFINEYATTEFGYTPHEAIGKLNFINTVIPAERQLILNKIRENPFEGAVGREFTMLRKDGSTFMGLVHYSPIIKEGDFAGYRGIVTNISEQKKIEKMLRKSEEEYRVLVENQNDLVVKVDADGLFLYVSPNYCNFFGKTEDELIGQSFYPFIHQDDRETTTNALKSLSIAPYTCYFEQRALSVNGLKWLAWSNQAILDKNNNVIEITGVGRDITEQKKAEFAYFESSQRNRAILEAIPDMMFVFSRDGIFLDAHAPNNETLLVPPSQFIGKTAKEVLPENLAKQNRHFLNLVFTEDKPQSYSYIIEIEGKFLHYDARMVKLDEDRVLCIVRDITRQRLAQEALRESEENYRTIFELANDSIIVHDYENGLVIDANKVAIESYGLKALDELKEYGYWSESPYGLEEAKTWNRKAYEEGPQVFEWRNRRIDGTYFWEEVHLSSVKILGTERIISISRDITNRKSIEEELKKTNRKLKVQKDEVAALNKKYAQQNEDLKKAKDKAEDADRLKSAFLANMSHEIRTPMNAIMGFSGLLSSSQLSVEKQKLYAQIIRKRSADLLKIIDDILDISKIEANQLKIHKERGNVNKLLDDLLDYSLTRVELENKPNLRVSLVNQALNKGDILADFGRLKQVLFNLIENAIKFTKEGIIEIGCKKTDEKTLLFYVKDTGQGIAKEKHTLIFERFSQVHNTSSFDFGGTGLGLAISKGLVSLMDGELWVESELDKGSTFFFTLPFNKPGNDLPIDEIKKEITIKNISESVLIVEDDEINAAYLQEILKQTNAPLHIAYNGEQALAEFSKHPEIKIILLDLRLPDFNGLDLIKSFKSISPSVQVIIQSAYATKEDILLGAQAGCDGYITKPVDQSEIIELIIQKTKKDSNK